MPDSSARFALTNFTRGQIAASMAAIFVFFGLSKNTGRRIPVRLDVDIIAGVYKRGSPLVEVAQIRGYTATFARGIQNRFCETLE